MDSGTSLKRIETIFGMFLGSSCVELECPRAFREGKRQKKENLNRKDSGGKRCFNTQQ